MRSLSIVGHLTDSEITTQLRENKGSLTYNRWQILYLIQIGKMSSAALISPIVSLSHSSIYKIVEQYNLHGVSSVSCKARGGRRKSYLSQEEEKALFDSLKQKATVGKIKTANDIRALVEAKVGKKVSDDYLWDLFNRNDWKKKMPRPFHPKKNQEAQEEFKKNSPTVWMP